MSVFELSPAARDDLVEIWQYIAQDNIDAADELLERFQEAMQRLAAMPGMGHERTELASERLSVWPVASYLIIYRAETRPLQIVRVVSGFRDLLGMTL